MSPVPMQCAHDLRVIWYRSLQKVSGPLFVSAFSILFDQLYGIYNAVKRKHYGIADNQTPVLEMPVIRIRQPHFSDVVLHSVIPCWSWDERFLPIYGPKEKIVRATVICAAVPMSAGDMSEMFSQRCTSHDAKHRPHVYLLKITSPTPWTSSVALVMFRPLTRTTHASLSGIRSVNQASHCTSSDRRGTW